MIGVIKGDAGSLDQVTPRLRPLLCTRQVPPAGVGEVRTATPQGEPCDPFITP